MNGERQTKTVNFSLLLEKSALLTGKALSGRISVLNSAKHEKTLAAVRALPNALYRAKVASDTSTGVVA
jgi:hypothetical protein